MIMLEATRDASALNEPLTRRERVVLAELAEDVTLEEIATRLFVTRNTVKSQVQRVEVAVDDLMDRTRTQAIRVDELVTRTIDKVEETTDLVQDTVITPVRQISGLVQGLSVGLASYLQRRRKAMGKTAGAVEDEELFI